MLKITYFTHDTLKGRLQVYQLTSPIRHITVAPENLRRAASFFRFSAEGAGWSTLKLMTADVYGANETIE